MACWTTRCGVGLHQRRKYEWDVWLPFAVIAINNAAFTLGCDLTPFYID